MIYKFLLRSEDYKKFLHILKPNLISSSEKYELELKLKNIDINFFNQLLTIIRLINNPDIEIKEDNEYDIVSSYSKQVQNNLLSFREIITTNEKNLSIEDVRNIIKNTRSNKIKSINYQTKRRLNNIEFNLKLNYKDLKKYVLTLSAENDNIKSSIFDYRSIENIRIRDRTSFFIFIRSENIAFRFDFTKVNTILKKTEKEGIIKVNIPSYEIEAEFLNLCEKIESIPTPQKYEKFRDYLKNAFNILYNFNHTIIDEKLDRYNLLYDILEKHKENKPINIQDKHLPEFYNKTKYQNNLTYDGLYRPVDESLYSVTNKLDGTKYNLFILVKDNKSIDLAFLANNSDFWLVYDAQVPNILTDFKSNNYRLLCFDIELIEPQIQLGYIVKPTDIFNIEMHIFDTIYDSDFPDILKKNHINRLSSASELILDLFNKTNIEKFNLKCKLYVKEFIYEKLITYSIPTLLKKMYQNFKSFDEIQHNNDGIIFQPTFDPYLVENGLPILKWKFLEKVSIDFQITNLDSQQNYKNAKLKVYNPSIKDIVEFQYNNHTFNLEFNPNIIINENMIVECIFNPDNFMFKPYRIRYDKIFPNAIKTALDTFKDMIYPYHLRRITNYFKTFNFDPIQPINQNILSLETAKENIIVGNFVITDPNEIISITNEKFSLKKEYDRSLLQVTSDCKKYALERNNNGFILAEIYNKLGEQMRNKTLLDAKGYCGSSAIQFAIGFFIPTETKKPPVKLNVISFENDELNYQAMKSNVDIYNDIYYSANYRNRLTNLQTFNDNFMLNYNDILNKIKPNILFINNHELIDINSFVFDILANHQYIDLIIIKLKSVEDTNNILFNYDYKVNKTIIYISSCLNIYRKFANEVKTHIIHNFCNESAVLDLGAGKGGDLKKYNNNEKIKKLYLLEPNQDNLTELLNRFSKINKSHDYNIVTINSGAENTNFISSNVTQQVDVISAFFSLTFFFETEQLLDNLVNTIQTFLNNKGIFVGTVMDGQRTLELLNKNKGKINEKCYQIKKLFVNLSKNFYNNKININLEGTETATSQDEYLVFFDLLVSKLEKFNIYLEKTLFFDDPEINEFTSSIKLNNLNSSESELNSLYRLFIFRKDIPIIEEEKSDIKDYFTPISISSTNIEYQKYIIEQDGLQILNKNTTSYVQIKSILENKNYFRFGAIGIDNNCFFHSFLIANCFQEYNNMNFIQRINFASKLRTDCVDKISQGLFEAFRYGEFSYNFIVKEFFKILIVLNNRPQLFYLPIALNNEIDVQIKDIFYKMYPTFYNFNDKVLILLDYIFSLDRANFYKKQNRKEILRKIIFKAAQDCKKIAFDSYKNSLLEKQSFITSNNEVFYKYNKDIDNFDVELFNLLFNRQTIVIKDTTTDAEAYMNYKK